MPKQPHIDWIKQIRECLEEALRKGETLDEFRARFDALGLNKVPVTRLPADWPAFTPPEGWAVKSAGKTRSEKPASWPRRLLQFLFR